MREVRKNIVIAAVLDLSVLITGEPDAGKELVVRAIRPTLTAQSLLLAGAVKPATELEASGHL
ncbi:MAG: sigma-54 factor interaction domain-containing protein [Acidobacteria bacterium]|nr:sigma-54 factor interaction domain-containing protein [Acidobacteriota bacterium]